MDSLVDRFDEVQQVASLVATRQNAVADLLALARLVGRQYAYTQILGRLGVENRHRGLTLDVWTTWIYNFGLVVDSNGTEQIWLGWDPVVVRPWRAERMASSLDHLAAGPQGGVDNWVHKPLNHRVNLWLPMRMGEAWNGNHSLVAGILNANGASVPAANVIDLRPLYGKFCDLTVLRRWSGQFKYRWFDAAASASIQLDDWRLAALFEIGRRLHNRGHDGRLNGWRPVAGPDV